MVELIVPIITVLGTLGGVWLGSKKDDQSAKEINEKNIVAEIVSKSRIEWIREVRHLASEFTSNGHNVLLYNISVAVNNDNTDVDAYTDYSKKFKKVFSLLFLYFNFEGNENKNLFNSVGNLFDHTMDFDPNNVSEEVDSDGMLVDIKEYMDEFRVLEMKFLRETNKYLNSQWRRSKSLDIGNVDLETNDLDIKKNNEVTYNKIELYEKEYHKVNMDDYQ